MPLPWDAKVLVGILGVSGVLHLVRPETYEPLMPEFVLLVRLSARPRLRSTPPKRL